MPMDIQVQSHKSRPGEQELTYPLGERLPSIGETLEVAPGVMWVRLQINVFLDHINVWLLRDNHDARDGWTLVDCGISSDYTRQQWEDIFAHHLQGLPILRVLVTHVHPDHIGLAEWICTRFQTDFWISMTDFYVARAFSQPGSGFGGGERAAAFYRRNGISDANVLERARSRSDDYPEMVPAIPSSFHRLMDGDTIDIGDRTFRCVVGHGHAPEHIALHSESDAILIAGDMVLPRISTIVTVNEIEPDANPLALFLRSIRKFRSADARTLVLPSHGRPFRGLHARLAQLEGHHAERLALVQRACASGTLSAAEVSPIMFGRQIDPNHAIFALGETLAHLHFLWHSGQLRRYQAGDGILCFSADHVGAQS